MKRFGLVGLFTRGLPLRIVMVGTLTGAQWGIYDAFKVFVGLYVPYPHLLIICFSKTYWVQKNITSFVIFVFDL